MDSRTPQELNDADFNYYLAYIISPSEKDAKKIETAMAQRKNDFTGGTPVQRRLIELYKESIEIMVNNPQSRDNELQSAKKIILEGAKKTIELAAKQRGKIYKTVIKKIVGAANSKYNWITEADIDKETAYLLGEGVKIIDDTKRTFNFMIYDELEKYLKNFNKKNLYDFSALPQSENVKNLSDGVLNECKKVTGKPTDPKPTAAGKIKGIAGTIFKDNNTKKQYDEYLATKDIWDELSALRSYGVTEIELSKYIEYSEKIKNILKNPNIDYIEVLLAEGLKNYGGFTVLGKKEGDESPIDLESCPYCSKVYSVNNNSKSCPHCNKPLEIVCWNCGGKAPYTEKNKTCPSCLAAKDHSARFDAIEKKTDNLFVQPGISITDIQTELNNLKNILPDYNKVKTSKLAKKAAEYQEKIDKKIKEEETIGKSYKDEYEKIQELVSQKKYFTAAGAAAALKNKYPVYNAGKTDALVSSITSVALKVKQHADRAKTFSAQNSEESAVSEIAAALDLSCDYIEAKQIISKFPPRAAENVNAAIKDSAALITWNQSRQQKLVTYTVIRKNGSKPTSAEDGTVIASELGINFYEDKTIVSDAPYYYGVFSSRLGINSSIVCSQAQIITHFDVSGIHQDIVSGRISVKWTAPLNVSEVEVIRKKGLTPPAGSHDGQKITVKGNESFDDNDYDKAGNSYLFTCVYKSGKGVMRSKGVTRTFKAFEDLKALSNVRIEQNGTTSFTLSCDKIISGRRAIFYSAQEISCEFGKTLQTAEFRNFNKSINEAGILVSDDNNASFNLPPDKAYYVYPAVCNEQLLIVSKPFIMNTMIGVSKISFKETSSEVIITGAPHSSAKNIIAKVSNTAFPASLNSDGDKITITKDDFTEKGFRVKLKANSDSYITIFAETENNNIKSVTCGARLSSVVTLKEKAVVQYSMKFTVSAKNPFPVKINFKSDNPAEIPELMLVKGNPRPLNKNDGQLVDRTPLLKLKKGFLSGGYTASVTIKSDPAAVSTKFALFPSAENKLITFKEVKNL